MASGSTGNCYHVSDGQTALLLDAGLPIGRIRASCNFSLCDIAACLVTHYHGDHSKGVKDLLTACVPVYMPQREIEALRLPAHHRLHALQCTERQDMPRYMQLPLGTFVVKPFHIEHDTPEPVGYLLHSTATGERLLYFTDTYFLRYRFASLTHIIGECNYDSESLWGKTGNGQTATARAKRVLGSHMSLDTLLDFLRANDLAKLKRIYICHMSNDHADEQKIKQAVQRLTGVEVIVC